MTTCVVKPASRIEAFFPPPRRLVPAMLMMVPTVPRRGTTCCTTPCWRYWKVMLAVKTVAPDMRVMTTGPEVALIEAAAWTVICKLFCIIMKAGMPAKVTVVALDAES